MRKILVSTSALIFAGALVVGGTYAAWTAATTIEGNTISTASVGLGQTGLIQKPLSATDMFPGDYTDIARVGIHNQSAVDLLLYMHTESLSDTSVNGVCDNTLLSIYTGHANGAPSVDEDGQIISGGNNEAARHIATKSVLEWMDPAGREELTGTPPFDHVNPNSTQVFWQQAQLDPDAPNNLQGQTCVWNEVFTGETL